MEDDPRGVRREGRFVAGISFHCEWTSCSQSTQIMQRVCHVEGGINRYLADPGCLVSAETRKCPFCEDGHALRLHGWYRRWALLPDPEPSGPIWVRRLYCPHARGTVSLLPDFCIPRRQHGPAILALFLKLFLAGMCLRQALRSVRREAPGHAVAQSLRDGFLRRAVQIRAYLAQRRHRAVEITAPVAQDRRPMAELFCGLVAGFESPPAAFTFHNVKFHDAFGVALA